MAENTLEIAVRAKVGEFERNIKQGSVIFRGQMQGMAREASTGTDRIRRAMANLGTRPFRDIDREITQLRASYRRLAASGQLGAQELAQANARMQEGIRRLREEKNGWVKSLGEAKVALAATAAAGYAFVRIAQQMAAESREFQSRMAEVNTMLDVTPARVAELSSQVRQLSVELGTNAPAAARALYDILSAGVPEGNAIDVLRQSIRAAVAGVTDTQSAAQVGLAVVNAYGMEVANLGRVYDVLFSIVKNGVTTLPQLAASLGQVLPIAAAASVPFEELAAAIAEMTKRGIQTPIATTALRSAITALSTPTPEAARRMQELDIAWTGLRNTLEQIARARLDPATMREIVPDVGARTAVLALTQDVDKLGAAVEQMRESAGAADEAYEKMAATPEQRVRELGAAVAELRLQLGDMVTGAGLPAVQALTLLARALGRLPAELKLTGAAVAGGVVLWGLWAAGLRRLYQALRLAAAGTLSLRSATLATVPLFTGAQLLRFTGLWLEHREATRAAAAATRQYVEGLEQVIARTRQFAAVQVLSTDELERLTEAELASYAERLRGAREFHRARRDLISREAFDGDPTAPSPAAALEAAREARAADEALQRVEGRLRRQGALAAEVADQRRAVIRQIGADEERLAELRGALDEASAERQKKLARDVLAERVRTGEEAVRAGQRLLDEGLRAERDAAERLKRLQAEIQGVRQSTEDRIRELRRRGMDEAARQADIEREAATRANEARAALAAGDSAEAARLAERAQALAERIEQEDKALLLLKEGGRIIEAAKEQEIQATERSLEAQRRSNAAMRQLIAASRQEVQGLSDALKALDDVDPTIEIQDNIDEVLARIRSLKAALEDLPGGMVSLRGPAPGFRGGGPVPRLASGGALPGYGGGDRVHALLEAGEFVVRKEAVRRYRPLIAAINALRVPGFRYGGMVPPVPAMARLRAGGEASGGATDTVRLRLDVGSRRAELFGERDQVRELVDALTEVARGG